MDKYRTESGGIIGNESIILWMSRAYYEYVGRLHGGAKERPVRNPKGSWEARAVPEASRSTPLRNGGGVSGLGGLSTDSP